MSYLTQSSSVADTKKAVISLWFRVPSATLAAATAEFAAWNYNGPRPAPMTGIVPLMTFGPPSKSIGYDLTSVVVGTDPQKGSFGWVDGSGFPLCTGAGWKATGTPTPALPHLGQAYVQNNNTYNLDPSYIGVDCTGPYPALSVHIVMPSSNKPTTIIGSLSNQTGYTNTAEGIADWGLSGLCPGAPKYYTNPLYGLTMRTVTNPPAGYSSVATSTETFSGPATILLTKPEFFRLLPLGRVFDSGDGNFIHVDNADQKYGGRRVTPDHWHHLLLSFDLTNSCMTRGNRMTETRSTGEFGYMGSTTTGTPALPATTGERTSSASKMWVAFDDVNLIDKQLSVYWPDGYRDHNAILTVSGYFTASDNVYDITNTIADVQGQTTTTSTVHAQPEYEFRPAAVPFSAGPLGLPATSSYVNAIKRVEMAELQIFTDVTIDPATTASRRAFVSNKGTPVDPSGTKDDPRSPGEKLLGKKPIVLLHTNSDWIQGKNTGTGSGQFHPTGGIQPYTPDPSL